MVLRCAPGSFRAGQGFGGELWQTRGGDRQHTASGAVGEAPGGPRAEPPAGCHAEPPAEPPGEGRGRRARSPPVCQSGAMTTDSWTEVGDRVFTRRFEPVNITVTAVVGEDGVLVADTRCS